MKLTFKKEELVKYLTPAMNTISDKNTIKAIEGILFTVSEEGNCVISSYDLEKGYRAVVPATVEKYGSYVIPAQKLYRIIRVMPDEEISIEVNEKNLVSVKSGKSEFKLSALPGIDFPNLPELSGDKGFSIKCGEFKNMISKIQHAISVNEQQRPVLCGAYFVVKSNELMIVSCDGNRLAVRKKVCELSNVNFEEEMSFIIPGKTLSELMKLLPDSEDIMNISFGRKHVIFSIEDTVFFSRLIEGEYINYQRIIPASSKIFVNINRDQLLASLERISLVADDKSAGKIRSYVKCEFVENNLTVSSNSSAYSVTDELEIEKQGEDIRIGVNCKFFIDALRCIDDEFITLSMTGPLMSIVIRSNEESDEDESYLYMLCPVKMVD